MAIICPPRALTKKEFENAINNGKKTIEKIDPALAKWFNSGIVGFFARKRLKKLDAKSTEVIE